MAPSDNVVAGLAQAAASSTGDKAIFYNGLLTNLATISGPSHFSDDLDAIIDAFVAASLGIVATRGLLVSFTLALQSLPVHMPTPRAHRDLCVAAGAHALETLSSHQSSYLDQLVALREMMATAHEANEDWLDAARVLADMPLDSPQRKTTDEEKARLWVRVTRNYLEVDDTTLAEVYVNKLKNIMHTVRDHDLNLHFKLSQARIQDAKREFLSAAARYHEVSLSPAIAEEDRLHTLGMAIKCAVLAPAGPLRSRALGRLLKDDRSTGLEDYPILEKIFFDRLLSAEEVDKFSKRLQPHQLAKTADGSTVLARAVVEHNLLGVSRLYSNITFDALGALLGLDSAKAEETTSRMIEQGRLVGRMDQLDGLVWFEGGEASGKKGSGRAEVVVGSEMRRWDANVQALAEEVENVTNAIGKEFPGFVAANLMA